MDFVESNGAKASSQIASLFERVTRWSGAFASKVCCVQMSVSGENFSAMNKEVLL